MRLVVLICALSLSASVSAGQTSIVSDPASNPQIVSSESKSSDVSISPRYYIGLIIDDMGYRYQSGKRAINLPANITYSFLPYAPHARKLANFANEKQKEIMLHIPMEASNGKALGPGGLTSDMPKTVFDLEVAHNLSAIPHIKGVNNHMGSLLTQQTEKMTWLMEKLAEHEMYFVDSRTSVKSNALKAARNFGIRSETRDIFVDHDLTEKSMRQQLQKAMAVAKRKGSAVVIAHPFPSTMKILEQWLPQAKKQGFEFVYISNLLTIRQAYREQQAKNNMLAHKRVSEWPLKSNAQHSKKN